MKKDLFLPLFTLLVLIPPLTGCELIPTNTPSSGSVTFEIHLDTQIFSEDATVRISLWDAEQLERANNNADCSISYNRETQTEEVQCPAGVQYQAVTPEEFVFPYADIGETIEVESANIALGEEFRLLVSGLSKDDCNTTSASREDTAQSALITIKDLGWMTTMMACP